MKKNMKLFVKSPLACMVLASVALTGCSLEDPIVITTTTGTSAPADSSGDTNNPAPDDSSSSDQNQDNSGSPGNEPDSPPPVDQGSDNPPPPTDDGSNTPPVDNGDSTPPPPPAGNGNDAPQPPDNDPQPPTEPGGDTPPTDNGDSTPPPPPADNGNDAPQPPDNDPQPPTEPGGDTPPPADNGDNNPPPTDSGDNPPADNPTEPPAPVDIGFAENGDVESGTAHWGSTGGNDVSQTTNESHTGSASAYITKRSATWHGLTFNVGQLTEGNQYEVSVWVKLAPGSYDTSVSLTAKRENDSDSSTYNEYSGVVTATASANDWTELKGYYTQSGTPFENFIIETKTDANVSFYADDFAIFGDVSEVPTPDTSIDPSAFFVGNITTAGAVRSDFIQYWNQITPENEGKWESVERNRDSYNWSGLDAAYNYAKAHNILFKQHTFVWGSQFPSWIESLSAAEQAAEIEEWIADYCTRYPDTPLIDVVNEATPGHAPANFAKNAFGDDWIIKSFQLAHQHCPNATLILNDYNVLSWHTDEFIAMARPAVNAGVVDAIGLQSHGLENFTADQLRSKLDKLAGLGLPIYISEYDIAETDDQKQLDIMKAQFPVFYNHSAVQGITLWGYVTGRTWRNGTGLISEGGTPRPAMTWLMDYLQNNPKN